MDLTLFSNLDLTTVPFMQEHALEDIKNIASFIFFLRFF
jgi:hypothetical protein